MQNLEFKMYTLLLCHFTKTKPFIKQCIKKNWPGIHIFIASIEPTFSVAAAL